jgi:class 3 adenylate cyclase/pimeloyl-ACP methyl ester carboxylesterase
MDTRYARNGDAHIAYQVVGNGPVDLVYIAGQVSHCETIWELPRYKAFLDRLQSFSRLIIYDKRGTGASDRAVDLHSLDDQMDDLRAVLDVAGSEDAFLFGAQDGASIAIMFAATYPARVRGLVTFSTWARFMSAPDYPWGLDEPTLELLMSAIERAWGDREMNMRLAAGTNPSLKNDPETMDFLMRLARVATTPGTGKALMDMYTRIDLRPVLPTVSVPTLTIARTDDLNFGPPQARYIADHVEHGRFVEIPGADPFIPCGDLDPIADEIEEFVTGSRHVSTRDRVLATVLFTDFVESTRHSAELGDRAWTELMDRHDALVRRELDRYRGHFVRHRGDGVLATFDGPARGIHCAKEIRGATASIGLQIRSGLHTGEVELRGDDPRGIAMNIGARVMEQAAGGEVLVSQTVKDLVAGSGIAFVEAGTFELRGVPGNWNLYRVEA